MATGIRHTPTLGGSNNPTFAVSRDAFNADHVVVEPLMLADGVVAAIVRGTLAARPAPSTIGRLYFAYDDRGGATYRDTGSAWEQQGSGTYQGMDAFNAKAYLAKGDWQTKSDGTMSASSAVLTSASNPFVLADQGKTIAVNGAGGLISTPVLGAFTQNASDGTMAAGTYYYRVAARTLSGTTLASTEASVVVAAGTQNSVTVNWAAIPDATSYDVYGRATGAELFMANVVANPFAPFWQDLGLITPSGALPGANTAAKSLLTTILTYTSAGNVTLAAAAATAASAKPFDWATDDTTALQAMHTAINTAGSGIAFHPRGTYLSASLDAYSNTQVVGVGDASVIRATANQSNFKRQLNFDTKSNVSIYYMTFDGNKNQYTTQREHNHAAFFNNCTGVRIMQSHSYDQTGDGFYSYGDSIAHKSSDVTFAYNRQERWGRTGCGTANTTEARIVFNYHTNVNGGGFNGIHIELDLNGVNETTQAMVIMGNTETGTGCPTFGLTTDTQNDFIRRYFVLGNIVTGGGGFTVNGGEDAIFESNILRNIQGTGFIIRGAGSWIVNNNQITDCSDIAIFMGNVGSLPNPRFCSVTNNTINHSTYRTNGTGAITWANVSDSTMSHNRVFNTSNFVAIRLLTCLRNTVSDNNCHTGAWGIIEDSGCDANQINDNNFFNFSSGPWSFSGTNGQYHGNRSSATGTYFEINAGALKFWDAVSKILPGATSISLRNNADSADNLIITDAGVATLRSTLKFATSASKQVPGATSHSLRNNADSADNLLMTDAGVATFRGAFTTTGSAGGVGYSTGAGGAVTQITSSATAVTLNKPTGQVTTVALTTAAGAEERFTVNNTTVAATDTITLGTTYNGAGTPAVSVLNVAANAFDIVITNLHATNALNAVMVINFAVVKAVAS